MRCYEDFVHSFHANNLRLHNFTNVDKCLLFFIPESNKQYSLCPIQNILFKYLLDFTLGRLGTSLFLVLYEWVFESDLPL